MSVDGPGPARARRLGERLLVMTIGRLRRHRNSSASSCVRRPPPSFVSVRTLFPPWESGRRDHRPPPWPAQTVPIKLEVVFSLRAPEKSSVYLGDLRT